MINMNENLWEKYKWSSLRIRKCYNSPFKETVKEHSVLIKYGTFKYRDHKFQYWTIILILQEDSSNVYQKPNKHALWPSNSASRYLSWGNNQWPMLRQLYEDIYYNTVTEKLKVNLRLQGRGLLSKSIFEG